MNNRVIPLIRQLQEEFRRSVRSSDGESVLHPRIIGTLCLGAPLELIDAIGAIPLRLMPASPEAELRGGRFLSSDACSFCKAVLGALDRGESIPDAVLGATTCDQMRRNLEIISRDLNIPVFIFNSPRTTDNSLSRDFARDELMRLADEMTVWAGVDITADKLSHALQRRWVLRQRLAKLVGAPNSASQSQLPLTGSEFFALMELYQSTSLDFFEVNLSRVEALAVGSETRYPQNPIRLALLGSCAGSGDDQIINLIEEGGRAAVVYDSICTGRRALREYAGAGCLSSSDPDDPFDTLLELYHDQIFCPHRRPNDRLFETVAHDVKTLGIQGIVYKTLKFCHPWGFEARRFKELLGLPFLQLDHELSGAAIGQLRTRIAAFIEQLSLARKTARP